MLHARGKTVENSAFFLRAGPLGRVKQGNRSRSGTRVGDPEVDDFFDQFRGGVYSNSLWN